MECHHGWHSLTLLLPCDSLQSMCSFLFHPFMPQIFPLKIVLLSDISVCVLITKLKATCLWGFSDISWLLSTVEDTIFYCLVQLERYTPPINIFAISNVQVWLGAVGQKGDDILRHFKVWGQWIPQWHSLRSLWLPVAMFRTSPSCLPWVSLFIYIFTYSTD